MKRTLVAALAGSIWLGAGGFASAQVFNWTGFYVGGNMGSLSNDLRGDYPLSPGDMFSPGRGDHVVAGFYGGYQFQSGNWVIGGEAGFDVPVSDDYASRPTVGGTPCITPAATLTCEGRIGNLFRAGGRLGWAFDRWLAYGTGGYARGLIQIRNNIGIAGTPFGNFAAGYDDGWYAGGGIEVALHQNVFLGVEYKHYDFGSTRLGSGATGLREISTTADSVMARLTIRIAP